MQFSIVGDWSAHDLLAHILAQTEPARVSIGTWPCVKEAARTPLKGLQGGQISELLAVMEYGHRVCGQEVYAGSWFHLSAASVRFCSLCGPPPPNSVTGRLLCPNSGH